MQKIARAAPWALAAVLVACGGGGGGGGTPVGDAGDAAAGPASAAANSAGPPGTRTFTEGDRLVMQRSDGTTVTRLGLDLRRGGMLVEASADGVNVLNAHDTGRGVQFALYDGTFAYDACAGCSGIWGWNPVQGGDQRGHPSGVLAAQADADALVVRVRPLQWLPGGTAPVPGDVVIEQRVTPVAVDLRAFRVDFRIELEGSASRRAAMQELPAAYAGAQYRWLVAYGGPAPWTGGEASATALLPLGETPVSRDSTERWFALVDDSGFGLTIHAPGSQTVVRGFLAPGAGGPDGAGAAFARLDAPLAVPGGQVVSGHYVVIVGDWRRARETLGRLQP